MTTSQASLSSSSTLWATPSKEWVIPAKPRPGRKAKKDSEVATANDDGPNQEAEKGRRIQNRAAQRAFRERKQGQIAELQARIQSYEKGEVQRNITLQNIAKRLKEENEKLLRENIFLKEKLSTLEKSELGRKRHRPNSPFPSSSAVLSQADHSARKKNKGIRESLRSSIDNSFIPSPSSRVSSPNGSLDNGIPPFSFDSPQNAPIPFNQHASPASPLEFSSSKPNKLAPGAVFPSFDCGFCSEDTPCVYQDIGLRQVSPETMGVSRQIPLKMEDFEWQKKNAVRSIGETFPRAPTPVSRVSILDNLPSYQPPISLPWSGLIKSKSIFPVSTLPPQTQRTSASSINCSGDPANCMACANDSFGKAFCQAVQDSTDAITPCVDCPCLTDQEHNADGLPFFSNEDAANKHEPCRTVPPELTSNASSETIPTSEAWRRLKSHPNVEFTDLALLADVVVRRSRCAGPHQHTVPPTSVAPVGDVNTNRDRSRIKDTLAVLGRHEHERDHAEESACELVPQKVLMECGQQRIGVREVRTDALKAALRLLDAKFGRT